MGKDANKPENHGWTSGRMAGINHERVIDRGGFGEVHKVSHCFCGRLINADGEKEREGSRYIR